MSLSWHRNPSLVPHTQHGHHRLDSCAYRWFLFKQAVRDGGWWVMVASLALIVICSLGTCVFFVGALLELGAELAR